MVYDFSFFLLLGSVVTGAVYGLDALLWRRARLAAGRPEPVVVEYARSFFPIVVAVLAIRSFLFEPFRIPSDSMMPTLLDGDFIFVNKFAYGLKLPVINTKVVPVGDPQRGDVIVFRTPRDPSVNFIKRLVALPGDRVVVRGDAITVNGTPVPVRGTGLYAEDACYEEFQEGVENLGSHEHRIMFCPGQIERRSCGGHRLLNQCHVDPVNAGPLHGAAPDFETTVPPGYYFFMGDNRDNSADSRFPDQLGMVPEANLVGKAVRIWLNIGNGTGPQWRRIGRAVN